MWSQVIEFHHYACVASLDIGKRCDGSNAVSQVIVWGSPPSRSSCFAARECEMITTSVMHPYTVANAHESSKISSIAESQGRPSGVGIVPTR